MCFWNDHQRGKQKHKQRTVEKVNLSTAKIITDGAFSIPQVNVKDARSAPAELLPTTAPCADSWLNSYRHKYSGERVSVVSRYSGSRPPSTDWYTDRQLWLFMSVDDFLLFFYFFIFAKVLVRVLSLNHTALPKHCAQNCQQRTDLLNRPVHMLYLFRW